MNNESRRTWRGSYLSTVSRSDQEILNLQNDLRFRKENPTIQQQFADLKRGLGVMTDDDWAAIPDVGDLTRKKGKKPKTSTLGERFSAVPDSVLAGNLKQTAYATALDAKQQSLGGIATPASAAESGLLTDFVQFGEARDKVLGLKLDQVSDSVSGQTTIDPKGYLTDLSSVVLKSDAEISDIKKARTLLKSVTLTNPKHAPGWIAAARLEEFAGKMGTARDLIARGCEECPKSEDIWLEAARLNTHDNAKVILANAVRHIPTSVKIWLRAADLEAENDTVAKKRVLRRALEFVPNSVTLWKSAVSLEEDPQDAKILLSRAVECVPLAVELWLALARLETYDNAKKVLNKARLSIPTSQEIWITAAKLEESQENVKMVDTIITRAVTVLAQKGSTLDRDAWIKEAEECEREGATLTCKAIINATLSLGLEEVDWKYTWMEDAESCASHSTFETVRAIYEYAVNKLPHKKSIWRRWAFFEKEHGKSEQLDAVLERAVSHCPQAEILWLMRAKETWLGGNVPEAKKILEAAFEANPNSEQIWLAAIKLEVETQEFKRARVLLASARQQADTERVWMKSALLERQLGNLSEALKFLEDGLKKFPQFPKLWMIKGQIEEGDGDGPSLAKARDTYARGIKSNPKSLPLWILASQLEEKAGSSIKARAMLEKARVMNPKSPELWLEAIRVEVRGGNQPMARALLAKGLQECPSSGLLWSEAILMEPRPTRKSRSTDALKKCENDALVVMTIARLFWSERKIDKARNWFNRAIKTDPTLGDAWAWWLKFEMMHGTESSREDLLRKAVAAEPRYGERWIAVSKDVTNAARSLEEKLKIVAAQMENNTL